MTNLGTHQASVDVALEEMAGEDVVSRIWAHDHTVWKPEPDEITNRLGWLRSAQAMSDNVPRLSGLADAVREEGYTQVLLLGMGGSSLAPELFSKTFGSSDGYLELDVLDSTDPGAVLAHAGRLDMAKTLFIVATKSGGTVETLSFFKYFYNKVIEAVGEENAGAHFVAITDPGSKLVDIAKKYNFRAMFINDANIGGRYSVLSYFGLVPAALIGVDVPKLLERALSTAVSCDATVLAGDNPAAILGAAISELAEDRRDKLTFITSPQIASFGDWVEQLIAESTGKEGVGILPVVGEPLGAPDVYGEERLFVHMRLEDDTVSIEAVEALEQAGHPVIRINLHDTYDLGGQFFLWEMATAIAGHRLGINPFDQPNVEAAKVLARKMVAEYAEKGALPEQVPALADSDIVVYVAGAELGGANNAEEAMLAFLGQADAGAYVALQAYVQPTADNDTALAALRLKLRNRFRLATTQGYGPRFLHSTGQLHKGDAGNGMFIQFSTDDPQDAPIPDEAGTNDSAMTFGVLKAAQVLGDGQALADAERKVIRFHFSGNAADALKRLANGLD